MLAKLANGEAVIKEYEYSTAKKNGKKFVNTLVVTNKRIIKESASKNGILRKEIPLKAADYVTTTFSANKPSIAGFIITLLLAIAFAVAAFFAPIEKLEFLAPFKEISFYTLIGSAGFFLLISIICLIVYGAKKRASVTVDIAGFLPERELVALASSNIAVKKGKKAQIKVRVDRETAQEMVNEIGALIMDAKSCL